MSRVASDRQRDTHARAMLTPSLSPLQRSFMLRCDVARMAPDVLVKGDVVARRRLGGWATTAGRIVDGVPVLSEDRDRQVNHAAGAVDAIDWRPYLTKGMWNFAHMSPLPGGVLPDQMRERVERGLRNPVYVGVPEGLAFFGPESEMAQSHGKWGWYTWGHLFDRDEPASWSAYTDHVPTDEDLERADTLWEIANALEETDARLGFSLHGRATYSPDRRTIKRAMVSEMAIVTIPRDPNATADILKGDADDLLRLFGLEDDQPLAQGMDAADVDPAAPQSLEGRRKRLIAAVMERGGVDAATAEQWVDEHDGALAYLGEAHAA